MNRTAEEQLLLNYLLGDLPDEERERVEERMFADDELYEQIEAMKAELADDYARGQLRSRERARYESRFLTSANGHERLAFARTMAKAFDEAPATASEKRSWRDSVLAFFSLRSPALQFSLAAAMLLLALGGGWLFWQNRNLQSQLAQAQAEQSRLQRQAELANEQQRARGDELAAALDRERAEREKLQKELDQARAQQAPLASSTTPAFVSFLLSPGLIRDRDEPEKLVIPSTARQIRLRLDTGGDDDYRSFRAELRTMRGALILSRSGLSKRATASGSVVPLTLAADALSPGEYELTLKGIARRGDEREIGYYYFNILKN
jgi:anti-sigma-K factor RskA